MSSIIDALFAALARGNDCDVEAAIVKSIEPLTESSILPAEGEGHPTSNLLAPETPRPQLQVPANTPTTVRLNPQHMESSPPSLDADTSISTSAGNTSSAFSTPMTIQLGTQSTPFILTRRHLALATPVPQVNAETPIRIETIPATPSAPQPVELCFWRKEQIKNLKTPRLNPEAKFKGIPAFHGPLSLPYARNPSGVDATVSDNSAYLSNVFGLKGVPSSDGSARQPSTGTVTSRSTSGSSATSSLYHRLQAHSIKDVLAQASNMTIVRDPHQVLGLRHASGEEKLKAKGIPVAVEPKFSLNPASSPFNSTRRRAPGAATLAPIADASAPASDPFGTLRPMFEAAIGLAAQRGLSLEEIASFPDQQVNDLLAEAGFQVQSTRARQSSDGHSNASVAAAESQPSASTLANLLADLMARLSMGSSALVNQVSKADASEDWRAKSKSSPHTGTPAVVNHSTTSFLTATQAHKPSPPRDIMTMEELLEKFGSPSSDTKSKAIHFKAPTPESPAMSDKELVQNPLGPRKSVRSASAIKVIDPSVTPKIDMGDAIKVTPKQLPARGASAKSITAKGTPGAGKLLKKSSSSVRISEPAKSKLDVIAEGDSRLAMD